MTNKKTVLKNILEATRWPRGLTDLQGLDKSPEKSADAFSFAEKFHQPQHSEQTEESDGHFSVFSFPTTLWPRQHGQWKIKL